MVKINYWASRPDRHALDFFWNELKQGRLRQGWGYQNDLDLNLILSLDKQERKPHQNEVMPQWRMAGTNGQGPDGWKQNDIVVMPNVPRYGLFAIARITGDYRYEAEPKGDRKDYRHIREVELLTKDGVPKSSSYVKAPLVTSLKARNRTWNLNHVHEQIEYILENVGKPNFLNAVQIGDKVTRAMQELSSLVSNQQPMQESLKGFFGNAEWEHLLVYAMQQSMPHATVNHTGGPNEQGADIEVRFPNPLSKDPLIVVQVKDHDGESGVHAVEQLELAIKTRREAENSDAYNLAGAVVVLSRAKPSERAQKESEAVTQRTGVPVEFLHGQRLHNLLLSVAFATADELDAS